MLLLHELGETRQIPRRTADAMAAGLDRLLHVFPIHPGDAPEGFDSHRDVACHCALGCMVPLVAACGVDVDQRAALGEPLVRALPDGRRRLQLRRQRLSGDGRVPELHGRHGRSAGGDARCSRPVGRGARLPRPRGSLSDRSRPGARLVDGPQRGRARVRGGLAPALLPALLLLRPAARPRRAGALGRGDRRAAAAARHRGRGRRSGRRASRKASCAWGARRTPA